MDKMDSLRLELEAERHNHRKDNEFFMAEIERLRGEDMSQTRKLTHKEKTDLLAKNIAKMVGFEVVDSTDGSPNWWIFVETAEKWLTDLEDRGFKVWDFDVTFKEE